MWGGGILPGWRGLPQGPPAEPGACGAGGADAVGMSTAIEAVFARYLGMRVAGISCITNMAAGVSDEKLDHADVLAQSKRNRRAIGALVRELVRVL